MANPEMAPLVEYPSAKYPSGKNRDHFIIWLHPSTPKRARMALSNSLANSFGADVTHQYSAGTTGFAARLTPEALNSVRQSFLVQRVERVTYGSGAQMPNLTQDRLDQYDLPLDSTYAPVHARNGAGAVIHVVDSGIRATHQEFAGRIIDQQTWVNDGFGVADCSGHGTHVAGIAAGQIHGIAPGASITNLRVIDCNDLVNSADVNGAIDYVINNYQGGGQRDVINLSLQNFPPGALAVAITDARNANIPVVGAAGNDAEDSCQEDPGGVVSALSVGATDSHDSPANFTNFGPCVDIWAPGVAIISASPNGDGAFSPFSGTSAAAPAVSGVVALIF